MDKNIWRCGLAVLLAVVLVVALTAIVGVTLMEVMRLLW